MSVRAVTFYLTRPVDASVSVFVKLRVVPVTATPTGKLTDTSTGTLMVKTLKYADFGTTGTEFTIVLGAAVTLLPSAVGVIIVLEVVVMNKDDLPGFGSGGRVEESLAYGVSSAAVGAEVFTLFSASANRTKTTHFTTTSDSGDVYETYLIPQMRFRASPAAGGLTMGHAASSDMFSIDTANGEIAPLFAPPDGAAPSAAVLTMAIFDGGADPGLRSDNVIEDAELGYGTVWTKTLSRDSDETAPST